MIRNRPAMLILSTSLLFCLPALFIRVPVAHSQTDKSSGRTAVLVELFTSEGCSSCPSADKLLKDLSKSQPLAGIEIVPLAEHVDYWDRLGWKDKFASPSFTNRQNDFARALKKQQVYTPQAVVDGHFECIGSDYAKLIRAIKQAAALRKDSINVSYKVLGDKVMIKGKLAGPQSDEYRRDRIFYAVFASGEIRSSVKSGENQGHVLVHNAVASNLNLMNSTIAGDQLSALTSLPSIKAGRLMVFGERIDDKKIVAIGSTSFFSTSR